MGFNKGKMEGARKAEADKEAAARLGSNLVAVRFGR
jgi:hypothetical protein